MPTFETTIRLVSADQKDYETLATEMRKNAFLPAGNHRQPARDNQIINRVFTGSTPSLLDASSRASRAAERTGRKFSFMIIKSKD